MNKSLLSAYPQLTELTHLYWDTFKQVCSSSGLTPTNEQEAFLSKCFICSDFIYKQALKYPEFFCTQMNAKEFSLLRGHLEDQLEVHCPLTLGKDEFKKQLRIRRNLIFSQIAISHIQMQSIDAIVETMHALSTCADVFIRWVVRYVKKVLSESFGEPYSDVGVQDLIVLGLGKLGGEELNFSSDIDLIMVYLESGETNGRFKISNQEYFVKVVQLMVDIFSDTTADGFVFRVDLRLRPFGDSGPLVSNYLALEKYYGAHGRDWERYALIKARAITGTQAQIEPLLSLLKPFVYRRYVDYGAFESLRVLKAQIQQEVKAKDMRDNIKLGPGGIRQIEFIAQAFQLIRGGKEPEFQSKELLKTLERLSSRRLLEVNIAKDLKSAYLFLRQLEHFIQAFNDQQTHSLPTDELIQARIAYAMRFSDWKNLVSEVDKHRNRVEQHFENISATPPLLRNENKNFSELSNFWQQDCIDAQKWFSFTAEQAQQLHQIVVQFKKSYAYRQLSITALKRVENLAPALLGVLISKKMSDVNVISRLFALIESIQRRSSYLALLIERPEALNGLVELCILSPWIIEQITQYPVVLDEVLDIDNPFTFEVNQLKEELDSRLRWFKEDDLEQLMDNLRHFKLVNTLKFATLYGLKRIELSSLQQALTDISEILLHKIAQIALFDLLKKQGKAPLSLEQIPFIVVAYGKLGAQEMTLSSDLDLVFIFDEGLLESQFYVRLAQRLIHMISTPTHVGALYEVDVRLRPGGRAGLLVTQIDAYEEYQLHKAWTFEHQALVRARVVAGNMALKERFELLRLQCLTKERDDSVLKQDIISMRQRIQKEKKGAKNRLRYLKGGMEDITFFTQYLMLSHFVHIKYKLDKKSFFKVYNTVKIIRLMHDLGVLQQADMALLIKTYEDCLKEGLRCHLESTQPDVDKLNPGLQASSALMAQILDFG